MRITGSQIFEPPDLDRLNNSTTGAGPTN